MCKGNLAVPVYWPLYGADNIARCARGIWLSQYIGHCMVLMHRCARGIWLSQYIGHYMVCKVCKGNLAVPVYWPLYGADNTARCARGIWLSQYIGHCMVLIALLLGVQGESGCPSILATVWCILITLLGVQGESGCPSILATVWC